MSLWISGRVAVSTEFNHRRAVFVLGKIDEICAGTERMSRRRTGGSWS